MPCHPDEHLVLWFVLRLHGSGVVRIRVFAGGASPGALLFTEVVTAQAVATGFTSVWNDEADLFLLGHIAVEPLAFCGLLLAVHRRK